MLIGRTLVPDLPTFNNAGGLVLFVLVVLLVVLLFSWLLRQPEPVTWSCRRGHTHKSAESRDACDAVVWQRRAS